MTGKSLNASIYLHYCDKSLSERKIVDDASYPNEWTKKEEHEGHEVRWKDGVSKEYGVHGVAVAVDFDICIAAWPALPHVMRLGCPSVRLSS